MDRVRVVVLGGGLAACALYRLSRLGEQAELVLADGASGTARCR